MTYLLYQNVLEFSEQSHKLVQNKKLKEFAYFLHKYKM